MRWTFRRNRQKFEPHVTPIVNQVSEDTFNNGLMAIYYGAQTFEDYGNYVQEITLVFKDEELRRHRYLDVLYRFIRRILYGRTVDIETFYIHVSNDKVDYCLFPKIYSGNNTMHEDNIHLDTQAPYPKHPIEKWGTTDELSHEEDLYCYLSPHIYINTSNHAMATHDTNPTLQKTLYQPRISKKQKRNNTNLTVRPLTRKQVEKKYKK